jgi:DNA-binding transcriptional ArsR family regulator
LKPLTPRSPAQEHIGYSAPIAAIPGADRVCAPSRPRRRLAADHRLAELEGLAQPTITILIKQLEEKGLVTRTRQSGDGRVVLINVTESGNVALEDYRGRLRAVLGGYLAEISDE